MHVVAFHNFDVFDRAPRVARDVIRHGYTGVSLFFVLSGFILAHNYLGASARPIDRRAFWIARFARVYPTYLLALLIGLPLFLYFLYRTLPPLQAAGRAAVVAVPNFLLVQAWLPYSMAGLNPPGWSLAVEAFLYLVFPFIGLRLARLGGRQLAVTIVVLWVVAIAPGLVHSALPPEILALSLPGPAWIQPSAALWDLVFAMPVFHVAQFSMGIAAGLLFRRQVEAAPGMSVGASVGEIALIAALVAVFIGGSRGWVAEPVFNIGLLAIIYVPLLLLMADGRGIVARAASIPLVVLLGEASYGIYILQHPVRDWMRLTGRQLGFFDWTAATFSLYVVVLLSLSVVAFRAEERIRPALRRYLTARFATERPAAGGCAPD